MPKVGDLVKPVRPVGVWRLGVVEEVLANGKCLVRDFVAPAGAYEGTASPRDAAELVVVPLEKTLQALIRIRAENRSRIELARQIENAVRAVEGQLAACECGGAAGQHAKDCFLARVLGAGT